MIAAREIGDVPVPPIGLGGVHWSLADDPDDSQSIRTIHAAIDRGVRLIDTAHAYTKVGETAHNEQLVARALRTHPLGSEVLVATKGGHDRTGRDRFPIDGRPETIRRHLEQSLRALGVEQIGLYQLHWPDPLVPLDESVQALADLQAAGFIRLIGLSNVSASQLTDALQIVDVAAVQNHLSPWRTADRPLIDLTERSGIAYLAYSPLGGAERARSLATSLPHTAAVASRLAVPVARLVLAWELGLSANIIPIVGATRPESIVASFEACDLELTSDDWESIDEEIEKTQNREQ